MKCALLVKLTGSKRVGAIMDHSTPLSAHLVFSKSTDQRNTQVLVRPADFPDISSMVRLLEELFDQETGIPPKPSAQKEGLKRILEEPSIGRLYVAEHRKQVVGMVSLQISMSTALGKPAAILEDIIVTAPLRGKGIGSQLLEYAIHQARNLGLHKITLLTNRSNRQIQRLYRRFGFRTSTQTIAMHALLTLDQQIRGATTVP